MKAVDISSYSGAVPSQSWEAMRLQDGVELAIVAGMMSDTPNSCAEASLLSAQSAGLRTATYAWLRGDRSGSKSVGLARRACGTAWSNLLFCALDCEDWGVSVPMIRRAFAVLRFFHKPVRCIYSAPYWWRANIGTQHPFGGDSALWVAQYDGDPTLTDPVPPMGFDLTAGKQWQQNVSYQDVNADPDTFSDEWIAAIEAAP